MDYAAGGSRSPHGSAARRRSVRCRHSPETTKRNAREHRKAITGLSITRDSTGKIPARHKPARNCSFTELSGFGPLRASVPEAYEQRPTPQ